MKPPSPPSCAAFKAALDVLGRPWTALILTLLRDGPLRFSELAERMEGVGDKTLSARLKDLEARGLVLRRVHTGPPVRVEYALTSRGQGFRAVGDAIEAWGHALLAEAPASPRPARRVVQGAKPRAARAKRA